MGSLMWVVGLGLVLASFGFLMGKPRQSGRPRISINDDQAKSL